MRNGNVKCTKPTSAEGGFVTLWWQISKSSEEERLLPPRYAIKDAHSAPARLRSGQCQITRECDREARLHSRMGENTRRCEESRCRLEDDPESCIILLTTKSIETDTPWCWSFWALPLPIRISRLHRTNSGPHPRRQTILRNMRRTTSTFRLKR